MKEKFPSFFSKSQFVNRCIMFFTTNAKNLEIQKVCKEQSSINQGSNPGHLQILQV